MTYSTAWKDAHLNVEAAQHHYKKQYDKKTKDQKYKVGDRIFIHMPADQQGKFRKLARPYHGPYRVLAATPTNIRAVPVDHPEAVPIFVNLSRVRPCFKELPDVSWTGKRRWNRRKTTRDRRVRAEELTPTNPVAEGIPYNLRPWNGTRGVSF